MPDPLWGALSSLMYCHHCGASLHESDAYCVSCGQSARRAQDRVANAVDDTAAEPWEAAWEAPAQRPDTSMRWPFKVLAFVIILPLALFACVSAITKPPSGSGHYGSTPEEALAAQIHDEIGRSNRDHDRRVAVSWNGGSSGERELVVNWFINDNLTTGMVVTGARSDVRDILAVVSRSGLDYDRVVLDGSFELVDQLGAVSEERVILATYERPTVEAMNFESVPVSSILELSMLEWLFVHPAFED